MAIFKTSTAAAIIIPIIIMGGLTGLFSGCGYFQAPKAKMDVTPLHVGIQSEDAVEWKKCQVILNESAGEQAYRYQLGNVKPGAHEMVFLSQFAQKDGKRFLPVLSKVNDATLRCQTPGQPITKNWLK